MHDILLLGQPISPEARSVLEEGGVLWGPAYSGQHIWTIGAGGQRGVQLTSGASEVLEERWARETAGFVLNATAEAENLTVAPRLVAFDGVSATEVEALSAALVRAGIDPSLVRTFRGGDMYSVTPFELGLVSVLGLVGVVVLVGAARGSVEALRRESGSLVLLGLPRRWFGEVFLREVGSAGVIGLIVGALVSTASSALTLAELEIPLVFPALPVLSYVGLLCVLVGGLGFLGLARLRS